MSEKKKENCRIISQKQLCSDVYSLWIQSKEISSQARPGQFVSLFSKDGSRMLPRPISICEIDRERNAFRLVYRVVGKGTEEFSHLPENHTIQVMGPLGNGFPMERAKGKKVFLIGGGIGIPPMLETAKELDGKNMIIAGYRDELFLNRELSENGTLFIATEDGSQGTQGNVLDAISANKLEGDVIFACGPTPMLRAIKSYALEQGIECWISMEEKMACGIGACLACVCQSTKVDGHSHVHNKRICKDGPVFLSTEVELS